MKNIALVALLAAMAAAGSIVAACGGSNPVPASAENAASSAASSAVEGAMAGDAGAAEAPKAK